MRLFGRWVEGWLVAFGDSETFRVCPMSAPY